MNPKQSEHRKKLAELLRRASDLLANPDTAGDVHMAVTMRFRNEPHETKVVMWGPLGDIINLHSAGSETVVELLEERGIKPVGETTFAIRDALKNGKVDLIPPDDKLLN